MSETSSSGSRRDSPASDASVTSGDGAPASLEARIERLERLVEQLMPPPRPPTASAAGTPGTGTAAGAAPPPRPASASRPRPTGARSGTEWLRLSEDWIGRVGIVLLLLGLSFLYRYAVERGWITPWLRVAFGVQVGSVLLVVGLLKARSRPRFSQVLLGGGIAVLYLTGWAAQALYGLVPWGIGFSYMATVTVLALALAERRRHQALAIIGAAGGLATPLLLESPSAEVVGLVAYTVLVLSWAGLLQLRRGWGGLLAVNLIGGMALMWVAASLVAEERLRQALRVPPGLDVWIVQSGVVVAWAVACAFPYLQGRLHLRQPDVWPPPPVRKRLHPRGESAVEEALGVLRALGVVASAVAVLLTVTVWDMNRGDAGITFVAAAAVLFVGRTLLRPYTAVSRPALEAAAVLLAVGTALAAGLDRLMLPLAVEAAVFIWAARKEEGVSLPTLGHVLFAVLTVIYAVRLGDALEGAVAPGWSYAFTVLAALAVAGVCGGALLPARAAARTYLIGSYVGFLAWLAWTLTPLPAGHGLTSAAWGACALVLLGVGVSGGRLALRVAGLATLAAVAAKLLLVDLAALDRFWRILLFLGFGGVFLGLGYALKGRDAPAGEDGREEAPIPGRTGSAV